MIGKVLYNEDRHVFWANVTEEDKRDKKENNLFLCHQKVVKTVYFKR